MSAVYQTALSLKIVELQVFIRVQMRIL